MKIIRKFNLAEIGKQYESIEIEIENGAPADIIKKIDETYNYYVQQIQAGQVR